MTQSSNRIFDELARLATDAAGAAQGVRREVETVVRSQFDRMIKDMDVATREEVEVLREMVLAARAENERLEARLKALEEKLAQSSPASPKAP
jgi:BMFP domain-containing protein YqiC